MPLSEGWQDQYDRMHRSRARLAAGSSSADGDEARDMLYHFFQDAYHLKDWILNDLGWRTVKGGKKELTQEGKDLENHITATVPLARCADICNGTKHFTLDKPRIPGKPAEVAGQGRSLTLPPFETRAEFGPVEHEAEEQSAVLATYTWVVTWDGQARDAVGLADQVIAAWDDWLKAHGLP